MTVIAMTREMGSRGRDVALGLAEELNLKLVQHELVEHVADKLHAQPSAVNRFLEGHPKLLDRWGIRENELSLFTAEEIIELAKQGNVLIRGWGANFVLRPVFHVLSVRVCATDDWRARVLMARIGLEEFALARKEIQRSDADYTKSMKHLFHADWRDPVNYDLVLNTERVSINECVDIVKHLAGDPAFQETEESRRVLAAMLIEARVKTALCENPDTNQHRPAVEVEVSPATFEVTLRGMVYQTAFAQTAVAIARKTPGVESVDNQIVVLSQSHSGI